MKMFDYYNKYLEGTCYIYGKSPGLHSYIENHLKDQGPGPRIGINDVYQHLPVDFAISHNSSTWFDGEKAIIKNIKNDLIYLAPLGLQKRLGMISNIIFYRKAEQEGEWVDGPLARLDAAKRSTLYSWKATVSSAVHFASVLGCHRVEFIGFQGHGYSQEFAGQNHNEMIKYEEYLNAALELCQIWGLEATVWGLD